MNNQLISVMALTSLLVACGGDDSNNTSSQKIDLDFAAKINSSVLVCDENTESVGTVATLADIKYFGLYVSELEVASASGDFLPVTLAESTTADVEKGISLLAFCGTDLKNSNITGTVATDEDISRVRFTIGVPEKYNHLDATTADGILNTEIAMHWSWTSGYKHARMDVAGWNIHIGSTACNGVGTDDVSSICSNGNRPTYTFENIDFSKDQIEFNYADLVMTSDVTSNTPATPPGCMSKATDPECENVFTALGLNLTTGSCKDDNCDSQSWVSVGTK